MQTKQLLILSLALSLMPPAFAQGDPAPGITAGVSTPPSFKPPVETAQPSALQQLIQQQQLMQSTPTQIPQNILSNPSISPLDQRSGLVDNAQNTKPQSTNGLSIGSATPQIKNSNLLGTTTNALTSSFSPLNFNSLGALLKSLADAQHKAITTTTTTTPTTTSVTENQKKEQLKEKQAQLENAQNKIQDQIATTQATDKVKQLTATVGVPSTVVNTAVSMTSQAISTILTGKSAVASAAAKAIVSTAPDPAAIFQGALLQGRMAQLKLPPILIGAVATKAALGHFNNSSILMTMFNLLSTPGITTADAQIVVLTFLQATSQPTDIPVSTLLKICEQTSTTPSTTSGAAPNKSDVVKELANRANTLTKLTASLQTSISKNPTTAEKTAIAGVIKMLSTMVNNLQTDTQTMMGSSSSTIQNIFDAAESSSNTVKQLLQSQSN